MPSSPPIEGEGSGAGSVGESVPAGEVPPTVNTVPPDTSGAWWRFAVAVLVVVASLTGAASGVAWWARQTALDTDTYTELADEALGAAAVQDVIARQLVGATLEVVDVEELAATALPGDSLDFLGGRAEGLARGWLEDLVADLLSQPGVRQALGFVNRAAHEQIVPLLRDENEYLRVSGDALILDLTPVTEELSGRLESIGLEAAVDRFAPDDLEYEVYELAELGQAKRAVDSLDMLVIILPIVAVAAGIGAVALARRRARTIAYLGVGLAVAALATLLVEAVAQWSVLSSVTDPVAQLAGDSLWDLAAGGLVQMMLLLAAVGVVLAGIGMLLEHKGPRLLADRTASRGHPTGAADPVMGRE